MNTYNNVVSVLSEKKSICYLILCERRGGLRVSALDSRPSSPGSHLDRGHSHGRWAPANVILGVTLWWLKMIASRNTPGRFMLQDPGWVPAWWGPWLICRLYLYLVESEVSSASKEGKKENKQTVVSCRCFASATTKTPSTWTEVRT